MMRHRRRPAASVIVALTLLVGASACGSDREAHLTEAVEELASVSPGERQRAPVEFVGCDDGAEMPMAFATFEAGDAPTTSHADAYNAWLEEITQSYLPLWRAKGWRADGGSAFKSIGGTPVRASIDSTGKGYMILAVKDGDGLCDHTD